MSSSKYATPLHLDLKPSRIFFALLSFMYGGAALVLLIVPIYSGFSVLFILLVALSFYLQMNLHFWMNAKKSVVRLVWLEGHQWQIIGRDGASVEGALVGRSYFHTGLVILRFQTVEKETRVAIVFADSVAPESHRQLRVRLRLQTYS